jgi:lincosamide nucleotidyltransferase
MTPGDYHALLDDLQGWAEGNPDVLALVAVGSTSGIRRRPDEWSDHDLLIVTVTGTAERYRSNLSWLPEAHRLVLAHRGTPEALALVRDDGHLMELAIFDDAALEHLDFDTHRTLTGNAALARRLEQMRQRTDRRLDTVDPTGNIRAGQLIFELLVGLKRYARGESLSAHQRIRGTAIELLLGLIADFVAPEVAGAGLDRLDPHRRFERAYPTRAKRLQAALDADVPTSATAIVRLMAEDLATAIPMLTPPLLDTVQRALRR